MSKMLPSLYQFKILRKEWTDEIESTYGVRPGRHRMKDLLAQRFGYYDYNHYRAVLKKSLDSPSEGSEQNKRSA